MVINTAELLCVGTEILIGDIVNTNAAWLSRELSCMGISQYHQAVIGDNSDRLSRTISSTLAECDLLVITGGLGPTYDDITKETVARLMGKELIFSEELYEEIHHFFRHKGKKMTENNRKQAYYIDGCTVLRNDVGTAPGMLCRCMYRNNEKIIVLLPGPPEEMKKMWSCYARPVIEKLTSKVFVSKNINIIRMGEAEVAQKLDELMRTSVNPTVAPYCKTAETRLRITASADTREEASALCDRMIERIRATEVGDYIYGIDTELPIALVELLRKKGLHIATAESCTGGLLAKMITDVSGSSEVFEGGMVTYSNAVKYRALGVSPSVLDRHGPYDHRVALQMAEGAKRIMEADIGVGITGVAGPGGGTEDKPVGTVYIAVYYGRESKVTKFKFGQKLSRDRIRELAAINALIMILEMVKKAEQ